MIAMAATTTRRRHASSADTKKITNRLLITTFVSLALLQKCVAFGPSFSSHGTRATFRSKLLPLNKIHANNPSSTRLYNNPPERNQFDISKPTFDLFSFRLIRSDALLRYNSLNQSEPLRINLYLLSTVSLLGYPLWCESVTGEVPALTTSLGVAGAGLVSAGLFWRERSRRSNQLKRMEKELNAGGLLVRLPVNAAISSVRPEVSLKELKSKRRVVAIRGSVEQLQSSGVLTTLFVLRRRLIQSQTLVVLVPTDATTFKVDWGFNDYQIGDALWLGDPSNLNEWNGFFGELVENPCGELAWFALNFNGRSIASGLSEPPKLLELLGQQLQPTEILDETDEPELLEGTKMSIAKQILEKQREFYKILTDSDDESKMKSVYSENSADEVNEVLEGGGRIDSWSTCLEPGARPSGMVISGSDVFVASDTVAYSTCIEFPSNAGIDGATLLAVQRWSRVSDDSKNWKLELHQTIPWSTGSRAGGTLRCDCRGCVALARAPESRTFGGLIG